MILYGCFANKSNLNNQKLEQIVFIDQQMRSTDTLDMEPIDKVHRNLVMQWLANGKINTDEDKFNAALILQHTALTFCNNKLISLSSENYYLAFCLSNSAFMSGYKQAAYLTAATYDRYLLYTEGFQKYGTQKIFNENTEEMLWAPIDSLTTDQERRKYGVPPLADLLKESKMKPSLKD